MAKNRAHAHRKVAKFAIAILQREIMMEDHAGSTSLSGMLGLSAYQGRDRQKVFGFSSVGGSTRDNVAVRQTLNRSS